MILVPSERRLWILLMFFGIALSALLGTLTRQDVTFFASGTVGSVTPRPAQNFVDSIGINTHLGQPDRYAYHNAFNSVIKPKIQELGIRHVRDTFPHAGVDFNQELTDLGALSNPTGSSPPIQFDLIAGPNPAGTSNPRNNCYLPSLIVMMQGGTFTCGDVHPITIAPANAIKVKAAENPNEPDHCPSYVSACGGASTPSTWWPKSLINNSNWPSDVLNNAQTMQTKLHSSSVTSGVNILAPAFVWLPYFGDITYPVGSSSTLRDYLQPLGSYVDRSVTHLGCTTSIETCYSQNVTPYINFFGGKQMVVTEAGYSTAEYSEEFQAKNLISTFFEFFTRGVERTYIYELWDNPESPTLREQRFGIIHTDGSPKPAFTWLKNTIALLRDSGSPTIKPLDMSISGDKIHTTLLQKSDNSYWLAIRYDRAGTTGTPTTSNAKVDFAELKNLSFYRPDSTNAYRQESGVTQFNLDASDQVTLVQITTPPTNNTTSSNKSTSSKTKKSSGTKNTTTPSQPPESQASTDSFPGFTLPTKALSDRGMNPETASAVVFGSFFLILLLVIGVYWFIRRHRRRMHPVYP